VRVRSALNHGPLPYEVGWAYQKALLDRRLEYMRSSRIRRRRDTADYGLVSANYDDGREGYGGDDDEEEEDVRDHLLLFEHEPTYTLGRGASVEHLTFLREDVNDGTSRIDDRRRLSRDYREIDASRLNVDRSSMSSSRDGGGGIDDEAHRLLSCRRHHASKYPPVYAPNGCPVHRVERGGEVTYHGPGQLVMYPLMNLDVDDAPGGGNGNGGDRSRRDLHGYLRDMEEVAMRTLSHYGVTSYRDPQNTGVWVSGSKIAASGVSCTRWITTHGLSLNVNVDLRYFDGDVVTPCGIGDRGVTSLERVLFGDGMEDDDCHDCPTVEEVGKVASECFGEVFGVDLIWGEEVRR
jgi:lipoyl(octanoyl) transferase